MTDQLVDQARAIHAQAIKSSDLAHEGAWVAREGWHEPPGSQYWHVTATRSPTKAGVEPYTVSKAMTRDPAVAGLLTFASTGLPQLCDALQAAQARIRVLEVGLETLIRHFEGDELHDEGAFDIECEDCAALEIARAAINPSEPSGLATVGVGNQDQRSSCAARLDAKGRQTDAETSGGCEP